MQSIRRNAQQRGAAIVEVVIALPILLAVILGAVQFGLIYQAKATLNHATLLSARAGAVEHAEPEPIRLALARGLAPLYSPSSSLGEFTATVARIDAELVANARIRILNPTREAFVDFGENVNGGREIPNDRLHARSAAIGAQSGVNIQDANILRVQATYGYELKVPLVNWFITRALLVLRKGEAADPFERRMLSRTRLPILATATVRMHSPARLSDWVIARADLPQIARFDAGARPPDESAGDTDDDKQPTDAHAGSNLGDGFLGFGRDGRSQRGSGGGGGSAGGDEGGGKPPGDEGPGSDAGSGDGANNGSPQQCPAGDDSQPFPKDPFWGAVSPVSGASLPGVDVPGLAVGNPIHVATGNKYQLESDIAAPPGPLAIAMVRHYNSASVARAGVMGAGWRHAYEARLHVPAGPASAQRELLLTQADGRTLRFRRATHDAAAYFAQRASDGELEILATGYRWTWPSGRVLHFDQRGLVSEIREGRQVMRLEYDDSERLVHVVDPQHRSLRFEYHRNGRLASIRTSYGAQVNYDYDRSGNLRHAVQPGDVVRRYHYEDVRHPNHLTGVSAGEWLPRAYGSAPQFERLATWAYDARGRATLSTHAGDMGRVTLEYAEGFTDVTDAFGRVTRYVIGWRDGVAFVSDVRGPGCGACGQADVAYEFNHRFQLIAIRRNDAPELHRIYDEQHRLVEIWRANADGEERLARLHYAQQSRLPRRIELPSVNPLGAREIAIAYRADGQPSQLRERGYAPAEHGYIPIQRRTQFQYSPQGLLAAVDGPREDAADVLRFVHDERGLLIAAILPDGLEYRIVKRDRAGRPERLSLPGVPDVRMEYDAVGRIVAVVQLRTGAERAVRYAYDPVGRVRQIVLPDGSVRRMRYEAARRTIHHNDERSGLTEHIRFGSDGKVVRRALLTPAGDVLRMLHYVHDAQRRLLEIRDGEGPPLQQFVHDDSDHFADRVLNPLGGETRFVRDALQRLESIVAPDGGETSFRYDPIGHMEQLTAPNGARTRYEHDDFGRRVRERSPDRGTTQFTYDPAGNLVERIDARGERTAFSYTPGGRLAAVITRDSQARFTYAGGRLAGVTDGAYSESYRYDKDGNRVEHIRTVDGRKFRTKRTYDARERMKGLTLASGERVAFEYDRRGALIRISRPRLLGRTVPLVEAARGDTRPLSALGAFTYGNGLKMRSRVDGRGLLRSRGVPGLQRSIYSYDDGRRLTAIESDDSSRVYEYDAAHRLTSMRSPRLAFRYSYDANGNRQNATKTPGSAAPERYGYEDGSNRLLRVAHAGAGTSFEYDAAGNPIRSGARRYEYNAAGRPVRLFVDGKLVAEYAYNVWGERIRKTVHEGGESTATYYLYEQGRLAAEADAGGRILREYLYLGHHPVVMLERGRAYWIHTDHLGAPIAVTDAQRALVWRAQYEPFGLAEVQEDPDGDGRKLKLNVRLPGQYEDRESGAYYNVMRYYDPVIGRYLEPDPLGVADGTNSYTYVANAPLMAVDPLGLYQQDVHYYMTLFLAITAGIDPQDARRIALATAFIDENPATRPLDDSSAFTSIASIRENQPQLLLYHFVLSDPSTGRTLPEYDNSNIRLPYSRLSPQLSALIGYATTPLTLLDGVFVCDQELARLQFFGEFLHAFEDTFSHRNKHDQPFDALLFGHGVGHGYRASYPDYTYNDGGWITRATRTFAMEMDTRDLLRFSEWADPSRATSAAQLDTLMDALRAFNAVREDEQSTSSVRRARSADERWIDSTKVGILNEALIALGYTGIDLTSEAFRYSNETAYRNRVEAFAGLDPDYYTGAILRTEPAD